MIRFLGIGQFNYTFPMKTNKIELYFWTRVPGEAETLSPLRKYTEGVRMKTQMPNSEFWKGQSFEVQTEDKKIFYTQFLDGGENLIIQRPKDQDGKAMPVVKGLPVNIFFFDIEQQGLYSFPTKLSTLTDVLCYIEKPAPGSIEKAQRRRYFRVDYGVEMKLNVPSRSEKDKTEEYVLFTHNISGGGLAYQHPKRLTEVGEIVSGTLYLKMNAESVAVPFKARVVNAIKTNKDVFRTALEFINMKESERTHIIKFCMFKQVEIRKKLQNG